MIRAHANAQTCRILQGRRGRVRVVNVTANEESERASDQRVRSEMLAARDPHRADSGSPAVSEQSRQGTGIFVRDDRGHRPRSGGVLGGERVAVGKKCAAAIALIGPVALRDALDRISHREAIQGSLGAEEAGLAHVIAMRGRAQQPSGAARAGERRYTVSRVTLAARLQGAAGGQMALDGRVAEHSYGSRREQRSKPLDVVETQPERTGPYVLLVPHEVADQCRFGRARKRCGRGRRDW